MRACGCIYITYIHTRARNWKVAQGFPWTYSDCHKEAKTSIGVIVSHTVKIVTRILKRRIVKKTRMYSEKMSFVLEEEKGWGCSSVAENNIVTNFGRRWTAVWLFHRLVASIWPCRLDQMTEDPKRNWHRLTWQKIDQHWIGGRKYDWTKG